MAREFKDSGIEWIGQIPKEWEVCPHKHIMFKKKEIQEHYAGQDIISLTMNGVVVRDLDAGGKMPLSFDGYQIIYPNNLLLCLFDIDVTPRCVGLINNYGVTSPAYSQFVVKEKGYPPYYDYLLRYMDDHKCLLHLSKNLRSSLTETDFGQIKTCIPPYTEQQKIADYLDKICGEVDEMVALQETMIEELKAYKQSVITEAVTKGLNPNVPMRNSGIDWIGEIPEHWDNCAPLKWFVNIILGKMLQSDAKSSDDSLEDYICAKDVHFGGIEYSDLKKMYFSQEEKKQYKIQKGDMLVVEGGAGAAGASIVQTDIDNIYIQNSIMIARPARCVDISYVCYSLFSLVSRGYVDYVCNKATIPHFTKEKLSKTVIALPPMDEQRIIASFLDTKCSEIDSLIALKQAKIEELKEYKKSVIYEYVTGKKEVV